MSTMRHEVVGDTMLSVLGDRAPAPAEWSAVCRDIYTLDYAGVLVVANGGGPGSTSQQRMELAEAFRKSGRLTNSALVTESPAHRGIVTVMNWMQKGTLKAYGPARFAEALKYVGVAHSARALMLRRIQEFSLLLNVPCIVPAMALDSLHEAPP